MLASRTHRGIAKLGNQMNAASCRIAATIPATATQGRSTPSSPTGERQDTDAKPKKERTGYEHGPESRRREPVAHRLTDEILIAEGLHG